jgi:hypothetical protein
MPGAISQDRENSTNNEARLAEMKGKNVDDMSDEDLEVFLAERKKLKGTNESLVDKARAEATVENTERDAYDAAAAEDQARTKAETAAKEVADQESAAALAKKIKSGEIGSVPEAGELAKGENSLEAYQQADRAKETHRGEAEVALSMGDVEGFQKAYTQMSESAITRLELEIQELEQGIAEGKYPDTAEANKMGAQSLDTAQYQIKKAKEHIEQYREYSIKQVQNNPEGVIRRDGFDRNPNKVGLLGGMLKEAQNYYSLAKKDGRPVDQVYPNATAKLEGAISTALRYRDPEVMQFLQNRFNSDLPMTDVKLSPELQKQIVDLKV